jgi:hypothetical protein
MFAAGDDGLPPAQGLPNHPHHVTDDRAVAVGVGHPGQHVEQSFESVRRREPAMARSLVRRLRQPIADHGDRLVPVELEVT